MTDHYSELDVPRDASAEEIQRAYRRKASKAHPDKGGSDEAMSRLNRAIACLGDPERRAQYDATGRDSEGKTTADEATELLMVALRAALAAPEGRFMQTAEDQIETARHNLAAEVKKAKSRGVALGRRRDRISVKDGQRNLVHGLIDGELRQLDQQLARFELVGKAIEAAAEMLKAYSSNEEAPLPTFEDVLSRRFGGGTFFIPPEAFR